MSTSESFQALRRANPRAKAGFTESVEAAAEAVRAQLVTTTADLASDGGTPGRRRRRAHPRRRIASAATLAVSLAAATAQGGTGRAGSELLVVHGTLYLFDPADGGWVVAGDPSSIDPDSGTTPEEYLAAVSEDVGGATLGRITDGMTGLTSRQLGDGSTVYSGAVAAGLIAREAGVKDGQPIRVLPFGDVAHDEAANPAAPLQVAVTVGADGVIRGIAVTWGTSASAWTYTVTYSHLAATPAPAAPEAARPLRDRLRAGTP
jgi:hypothetical protein